MSIAAHIHRVTEAGGQHTAINFEGQTITWEALGETCRLLERTLSEAGLVGGNGLIGLLGRNRLEQVASFIAILGAGCGLLLVNAIRPVQLIAEEIKELKLACLIGSVEDLAPATVAAAEAAGSLMMSVAVVAGKVHFEQLNSLGSGPFRQRASGTLIEIQTSGTTGAPKRIAIAERTVEASLRDGVRIASGTTEQVALCPKTSPTLMFGPLVHTSGTFNTLMSVFEVRPIVLFEKFDAETYRQALVRYRPKFAPLPPTALKMMLDSNATREDFASVKAVRAGTAPLPVALQVAFEEKFGVPVLVTYGATEFMGVVTSWTLDDHRKFGIAKRGSVGRVANGVRLRIVNPVTGIEVADGEAGLLEAQLERIDGGRQWLRTTDLARVDADGFFFIIGRADDAIIRGGFKVMAGKVADVLREYPGIREIIVVGRPDERLGEVPVGVIEPARQGTAIDLFALRAFAKERLTAYEIPARFHVVEQLPRTVSDKISRPDVHRLLDTLRDGEANV